ncbi:MAG: phosphate ABC transporter substrate-binding protein [Armatimonadota bacterium]|nr:phosphate ABC transporter substrate-binding protein [bacterium]
MRKTNLTTIILLLALLVAVVGCGKPSRNSNSAKSGVVQIKGSDTMVNLGQAWAEVYMKTHSGANVAVTGGGSGTGIAAMIQGTTDIAESSRPMKEEEKALAEKRGTNPVEHEVALDALSVIVNHSNPISKLTIDQLSNIFTGKITNWKQVGGLDEKIVLLSRDKNSGSHVFFLEHVVRRGNEKGPEEYAQSTLMMPSSEAIASQVATDKGTIGYVGLGYVDPKKHKALTIAKTAAGPFIKPSIDTAIDHTYPISRPLYWYTNGQPKGEIKSLLEFVMSTEGQNIVDKLGFAPIKKS